MTDDLLTREEAAALLKLKPCTLALWACRRIGPRYSKMMGRVRYRRADLEQWVNEQMQEPLAAK